MIDQGLPPLTAELLRERGLDAVHVSEIGWSRVEDIRIVELAQTEDRVVITLDRDFHEFIALTSATSPSTIWIRVANLSALEYAEITILILNEYKDVLIEGVLVTFRSDRTIRTRLLPIL